MPMIDQQLACTIQCYLVSTCKIACASVQTCRCHFSSWLVCIHVSVEIRRTCRSTALIQVTAMTSFPGCGRGPRLVAVCS